MGLIWFMLLSILQTDSFKQSQMRNVRVKNAFEEKTAVVTKYFTDQRLRQEGCSLFLRAFKEESIIEVWVKEKDKSQFVLLHTYAICASSGVLGPKRKEGDLQVPEGVYEIQHFNPVSNFHLSLGINYPNASDRILSDRKNPGSQIYIHGNCVTVGCLPMTDEIIKELYVLAVEAKNDGQLKIPVHIFPLRMDDKGLAKLKSHRSGDVETIAFWENLQTVFKDFESSRKVRKVKINTSGRYYY
jgi:murein L,D-transpeptidase YafK